jgi:dihydroflavonol-4-reductase
LKILVTGASGFVGAAVVRRLVADGDAVRALVRSTSNRGNLAGLDVEVVEGDLSDSASLRVAVAGCQGLFHVAADYRLWVRHPEEMFRTNVAGTHDIMRAAADAGVEKIVYTSSVGTLGLPAGGGTGDEETPVSERDMIGVYKRSKFRAEQEVRRLIGETRLPAVIVNPSAPVGPGDLKPTPTGRMVVNAASGRMPAYVDTGLNIVHVDDVADGHLLAYRHGQVGQRYVLGGENLSLREILREIATIVGRPAPRFRLPHNLVLPVAYAAETIARMTGGAEPFVAVDSVRMAKKKMYYSSEKAKSALGYSARPAREALRDAVAWFREHDYIN